MERGAPRLQPPVVPWNAAASVPFRTHSKSLHTGIHTHFLVSRSTYIHVSNSGSFGSLVDMFGLVVFPCVPLISNGKWMEGFPDDSFNRYSLFQYRGIGAAQQERLCVYDMKSCSSTSRTGSRDSQAMPRLHDEEVRHCRRPYVFI